MKIEPCPWCGAAAKLYDGGYVGAFVKCDKCQACGPDAIPEKDDVVKRAIAAWNRVARAVRRVDK